VNGREKEVQSRTGRPRHPHFAHAVFADARITAANRGERFEFRSRLDAALQALRLAVVTDAFFAQCCYRLKARCQSLGIPGVPRIAHRIAIATGQVSIGDPVLVRPGVYFPHGQVVIDGIVDVDSRVVIAPFVTIGLLEANFVGAHICRGAHIGTGAKVLGPVRIGVNARVGANAVVRSDVPDGMAAVGVPARVVERRPRSA
jgi:serine acetyltransferase